MELFVPASVGEVVDRMTILTLKIARLTDPDDRDAVRHHRDALVAAWCMRDLPEPSTLTHWRPLSAVNARLWDLEEGLRAFERESRFDEDFVAMAREVYRLNDQRSRLKRQIDEELGSVFTDPKSHF